MTMSCRYSALLQVIAVILAAAAVPFCHGFTFPQTQLATVRSALVFGLASTGTGSSNNNNRRDYVHHRRTPSARDTPSRTNNINQNQEDMMSQAQMEFLMNDIQSPPTSSFSTPRRTTRRPTTSASTTTNSSATASPVAPVTPRSPTTTTSPTPQPSSVAQKPKPATTATATSTTTMADSSVHKPAAVSSSDNSSDDDELMKVLNTSPPSSQPQEPQKESKASTLIQMDRAAFRMDGLEVYAVVSALTLATSIQFFELLSSHWQWGAAGTGLLGALADLICISTSALGMITGLHSTFIFSLMTVYGRTAVGMGWDKPVQAFFQKTDGVRHRAFRSFRISLYTFLVQILFIVVSRLPPSRFGILRRVGGLIMAGAMWKVVYCDTKFIMDQAGSMLFAAEEKLVEVVGASDKASPTSETPPPAAAAAAAAATAAVEDAGSKDKVEDKNAFRP